MRIPRARTRATTVVATTVVATAVGAAAATLLAAPAPRAEAACHLASFDQRRHSVGEGAGSVAITVVLEGDANTCSGSVRYATEDGTARSPRDFEAAAGTLCFRAGDEQKAFDVQIVDDSAFESDEEFTVRLDDAAVPDCGPDEISPGSRPLATVTVRDNEHLLPRDPGSGDGSPEPTGTPPRTTPTPVPEGIAPVADTAPPTARNPTSNRTPTVSPSPAPATPPTEVDGSPRPLAVPGEVDDGAATGLPIGTIVAGIGALGGLGGLWYVRRLKA